MGKTTDEELYAEGIREIGGRNATRYIIIIIILISVQYSWNLAEGLHYIWL